MDYIEEDESFANTVWSIGVTMMVAGSATDLAAFGFAALSLLAPLDGISMCVNAFISQQFLGETIKQLDMIAMAIIITGCTVTVFFGAQGNPAQRCPCVCLHFLSNPVLAFFLPCQVTRNPRWTSSWRGSRTSP